MNIDKLMNRRSKGHDLTLGEGCACHDCENERKRLGISLPKEV